MTTDVLPQERLQAGRRHVNAMFAAAAASTGSSSNSSNGITDQSSTFPSFTLNQLTLGKVLGKGGFCTVSEVRAFAVNNSHDATEPASDEASSSVGDVKEEDDENDNDVFGSGISRQQQQSESRRFIAKHCLRESSSGKNGGGGNVGDARYAIKELSVETKQNAELFLQGLIDMAVETRFLSDLTEHPNIIKMRATCQTSDGSPFSAPQQYFIVMDRLYDTLEKRLQSWKKQSDRLVSLRFVKDRHGNKAAALYEERIVAAFDLSAALSYLHDRQIIYRDLKPENIGFDIRNDVKIFDFGLAKDVVMAKERYDNGTYKLTEMTGSPRYMAPEVALGKPYNEKCDVYSFAILLWEMVTMNQPYQLLGMKALQTRVWSDDGERKRPYIPNDDARGNKHKDAHLWKTAGGNVKLLLQKSWCADLPARNSMAQVYAILRRECIRARKGDDSGLEHNRRRSTFVFRPSPTGALHNNNNNKEGSLRRTGGALLQRMTSTRTSKANKIPPSSSFLAPTANTAKAATMTAATDDSMQQKTASSPSTLLPKAAAVSAAGGPKKTTKFAMDKDECSV